MVIYFYNRDGSPEMAWQYTSPGRGYFDQNSQVEYDFTHREGEVVSYHVGHGIFRSYLVEAKDAKVALLRAHD
jgi:hypothetical protein